MYSKIKIAKVNLIFKRIENMQVGEEIVVGHHVEARKNNWFRPKLGYLTITNLY